MTPLPPDPRRALVFGGSGQIGRPLLSRLVKAGWQVDAVSRAAQQAVDGVRWLRGDLTGAAGLSDGYDAIVSAGPLDHFARWYAASTLACPRVVAFGSTSVEVKQASMDAGERDLAARLQAGEDAVFAAARARESRATLLRPTLVYGAGADRSLTRIVSLARRWGRVSLPRSAIGLRQPVHVDDLADAAIACIDCEASHGRAFALPGGEAVTYREMVTRVLATQSPPPALHALPSPVFDVLLGVAHALGIATDFNSAALQRMRQDLAFDATPARDAFGYAPRSFTPDARMFEAG